VRRIFIGDIQGCAAELDDLLVEVQFDPALDELHPVGDLVNRGPDSLGVLRRLRDLDAGGVLGNHDVHTLRRARGDRGPGKRDTLDKLFAAEDGPELLEWLSRRPLVRAWEDIVCVHAALSPTAADPVSALQGLDPLGKSPEVSFAISARYCDAEGQRPLKDWPPPEAPFVAWYKHWQTRVNENRTVVFGHWARNGLVLEERVRGLDTGCVWGKQLTAWIAEEDRIVQVSAARAYSPTSLPKGPGRE
jgi:bis(5'-nucleosyl)-tetraphosphatase (symmetrical)